MEMKPREKGKGVNVGQDGAGGVYFQTCPGPGQGMMVLAVPHLCSGETESSPLRSTFLNVSLPTANSHTIKKKKQKAGKAAEPPNNFHAIAFSARLAGAAEGSAAPLPGATKLSCTEWEKLPCITKFGGANH